MNAQERLSRERGTLPRAPGAAGGLWRIVETAQDVLAKYERLSVLAEDEQVIYMMNRLAKEKRAQLALLGDCLGWQRPGPDREPKGPVDGEPPLAPDAVRPETVAIGPDCAYRLVVWAETRLWIVCIETALSGYNRRYQKIAADFAKDQNRVLEIAGNLVRQMGVDEAVIDPSGSHDDVENEAPDRETDTVNQQPGAQGAAARSNDRMHLASFAPAMRAGEKPADDSEGRHTA